MAINRRFLNWGVFFISMGAVLLVVQGAAVGDDDLAAVLRYWPVLVIALGVGLLLRRTRFSLAGGMLAAAMPGLLLGGMIAAAPRFSLDCSDLRPASLASREGSFSGAAAVELRLACGDLEVTTAPGSAWVLRSGGAVRGPVVDASIDRLVVASATRNRPFGIGRDADTWKLALPTGNPIDLATEISAGTGTLDLAGARLGDVRLTVNAGDARVDLGSATLERLSARVNAAKATLTLPATSDFTADLRVNAGAISVCAPAGLGLRITGDRNLSSTTYPGLVRSGDAWVSPDYATAAHHADVTVTANVGSVDLNPEGGCK
jgi:hypothetical protein